MAFGEVFGTLIHCLSPGQRIVPRNLLSDGPDEPLLPTLDYDHDVAGRRNHDLHADLATCASFVIAMGAESDASRSILVEAGRVNLTKLSGLTSHKHICRYRDIILLNREAILDCPGTRKGSLLPRTSGFIY